MSDLDHFTDVLNSFVYRSAYTPGQLASLSSVPKTTIVNWLRGRVQRPRGWRGIVALAVAMRLTEAEANRLLQAAQQPSIQELRTLATGEEVRGMLAFWQTAVSTPSSQHPPFQVVALPPYFVGREEEQAALQAALLEEQQTAVTCLYGMAGVGKTSLAAQMAYQLRTHFTDGVLWARLDGSDTMSILATFADAYQRDVSQYHDVASRSRIVRNLLMSKRVLMVLDNAQTSEQIEPLLPPTGHCAVLVTTRRQDLAILAGAKRFEIRPFAPNTTTSLALFEQILGSKLVRAESELLAQIAAALGHLPLALVIAASRLAYEPGWQIQQFGQRLQSVSQRLGALRFESQNVRRLFQFSYDLLDAEDQRLFAAAGHLGRQAFSAEAAAAVAQLGVEEATDGLRRLHSLSLLQSDANGRFYLHPLLQDFAQSLPRQENLAERLVSYWTAFVADNRYDHAAVGQEMGHIEVALTMAVQENMIRPLRQMLANLMPHFVVRGAHLQAEQYLIQAQSVLEAANDEVGLTWIQLWLGQIERHRHDLERAESYFQAGFQSAKTNNDRGQAARFLIELGIVYNCRGQYEQGKAYLTQALPWARQEAVGDSSLNLLEELGILSLMEGNMEKAESYYQEGLDLSLKQGNQSQVVIFLKSLGALRHLAQNWAEARALFEQGYALAQKIGFRRGQMLLENNLGVVAFYQGDRAAAKKCLQVARQEAERLDDLQALELVQHNLACEAWRGGQELQSFKTKERLKVFI